MKVTPVPFSQKQLQVLTWWLPGSPVSHMNGIIADGAIRAGKTYPFGISFIEWAFHYFDGQNFAICGKSVGAARRNVIKWLLPTLQELGYMTQDIRSENMVIISRGERVNTFYIFGGKDESSQDLVQGLTLAGLLLDEVALMPESFVLQATGRCSIENSKIWFNCNPGSPAHKFKTEWVDKAKEKGYIHLHFTMDDNPSLSEQKKLQYQSQYVGVFYKRMILGLWVMADGAIYDQWTEENQYTDLPVPLGILEKADRDIAVDYGTINPMVFLDIRYTGELVLIEKEYYYDGRQNRAQKTDAQYADDFDVFTGGPDKVRFVIIDPSAASFRTELRNRGYRIKEADNNVLDGIRLTSTLIAKRILRAHSSCVNFIKEIGAYVWDTKLSDKGKEQPIKANDHAMDACRYWVKTMFKPRWLIE